VGGLPTHRERPRNWARVKKLSVGHVLPHISHGKPRGTCGEGENRDHCGRKPSGFPISGYGGVVSQRGGPMMMGDEGAQQN